MQTARHFSLVDEPRPVRKTTTHGGVTCNLYTSYGEH